MFSPVDGENEHDACANSDETAMGPGYRLRPNVPGNNVVLLQKPYDAEENQECPDRIANRTHPIPSSTSGIDVVVLCHCVGRLTRKTMRADLREWLNPRIQGPAPELLLLIGAAVVAVGARARISAEVG